MSHLDTQMGRIIDALQQAGVAENTYIIFTSDHGLAVGRHGLIGKQSMFEHSLRVPFVITGPGIPKGEVRDARILILYPTSKTVLLFDLAKDSLEKHDLAADPATLALQQRLFAKLLELQRQLADPLDLTASFQALATP